MKHFFRPKNKEYILLSLLTKRENIEQIKTPTELFNLMRDELNKDDNEISDCIIDQFKRIYDAADIIFDKRLDKYEGESDDERKGRISSRNELDKELEIFIDNDNEKRQSLRENALIALWDYADRELSRHKYQFNEKTMVYSCLAKGNICHRLSNLFFDDYDLKASDMWGSRANELLWNGKNLIGTQCSNNLADTDEEVLILKLLVSENMAKYYRDYASRNRRSDFLSAERIFEGIITSINSIKDKAISEKWGRQFAILYIEALRNLVTISNRRRKEYSLREAIKFSKLMIEKCSIDDIKLKQNLKKKIDDIYSSTNTTATNSDRDTQLKLDPGIISCFEGYDANRILLLSLLMLSRSLCSEHEPEKYKEAIILADLANQLSHIMDDSENGPKNVNVDALIIISCALRKYCIYANTTVETNKDEELFSVILRGDEGSEQRTDQIFTLLKEFSDNGHLSSKTELIKWYCMSFRDRKHYAHGHLSTILNWNDFPNDAYINKLFNKGNNNALMEFYHGKMLFDTSEYSKAVTVLENLIDPNGQFNSVTYYVRTGTIGLKARYLLANTYMAQGNYYQAMVILKDVNETLNGTKDLINDENNEHQSGFLDLRILIDLAYCYIKRGAYNDAFKLYNDVFFVEQRVNDNQSVINDHFLEKLPKYKRVAGINNLITCCILSGDGKMERIGKILLDEVNRLNQLNLSSKDFFYNPETNLIRGYREVLEGDYAKAQTYFELSSPKRIDYRAKFFAGEKKEPDLGALYNNVEYVSAYLINTIRLYQMRIERSSREKDIRDFIEGLPDNRLLSLKAAMAMARWLIEYETDNESSGDIDSLYRYFSYIRIYEERGASAFNQLYKKNNGYFRLFRSVERGKILARLLVLYQPINRMKEQCTYSNHNSQESGARHLVHYTSLDTLKVLINKDENSYFRLSNCDYANDIYEGHVFFDCIEKALSLKSSDETLARYKREYFNLKDWQSERAFENEQSIHAADGSDVYIGSFSLKTDSFPMWTIYSQEETGCNIEFGEGFFDVFGKPIQVLSEEADTKRKKKILYDEYLPSRYTDSDFPLYYIQYIGKDDNLSPTFENAEGQMNWDEVSEFITEIFKEWCSLDDYLNGKSNDGIPSSYAFNKGVATVKSFAADLINEIRFLFKNTDFSYESEVRIVYTDSKKKSKIDYGRNIPMNYVEVNRKIENLTVTLGSKLSYSDVDKIETWLKHTGKVKQINLALTNRQTSSKNHK